MKSYRRVSRGDIVTLAQDVSGCTWDRDADGAIVWEVAARPLAPKGARVKVTDESNAGFRGIEFSFEYDGCRDFRGISTGVIR